MEQQDRQKKLEAATAQAPTHTLPGMEASAADPEDASVRPVILPPTIGEIVTAERPNMPVASQELLDAAEVEPHPIYAEALASESQSTSDHQGTGLASGPESEQAPANHG